MTYKDFDNLTDDILNKCLKMRDTKGKEYANNAVDRLANFKEIAAECGVSPLVVWQVYYKKHIRAIDYFVKHDNVLSEKIEGRFVDAITYMLLGYGLVVDAAEEKDKERQKQPLDDVLSKPLDFPPVGSIWRAKAMAAEQEDDLIVIKCYHEYGQDFVNLVLEKAATGATRTMSVNYLYAYHRRIS